MALKGFRYPTKLLGPDGQIVCNITNVADLFQGVSLVFSLYPQLLLVSENKGFQRGYPSEVTSTQTPEARE